jgi:uncharacterized damage-inducible protein DinB
VIHENEAAPYYFRYINLIKTDHVVETLRMQLEDALSLFQTISEEKSRYRYAPDKWSIRQLLSHVSDTERVFLHRAFWFARGFQDAMPSFDQDESVAAAQADEVSWRQLVDEFRVVRLATLSFFQNLPTPAWSRSGIASDSSVTVRALAYIIAGHVAHHQNLLEERYL